MSATLYYYDDNGTYGYNTGSATTPGFNFSDFSNEATTASARSVGGLYPTYRKSFCIHVEEDNDNNLESVYLTIPNLTVANAGQCTTRWDVTGTTTLSTNYIYLANTINIYTGYAADSSTSPTMTSSFTYSSSTTKYQLFSKASGVGSECYLYFTVEFSRSKTKSLFVEYKEAAKTNIITDTPSSSSGSARYFKTETEANGGNSNAYEGLDFTISNLTVSAEAL